MAALSANDGNLVTIEKLKKANQECTAGKEANAVKAVIKEQEHNKRIIDLKAKYDAIKQTPVNSRCANMLIDSGVVRMLTESSY